MQKRLAQNINKHSKKTIAGFCIDPIVISNIGSKLLKEDRLSNEDIYILGQLIAEQQEYDLDQLIICGFTELKERFMLNAYRHEAPVFIMCYDNQENTSAVFCIVGFQDQTVCLYQDFQNHQDIPEYIKDCLEQHFGNNIRLKINATIENNSNHKDVYISSLNVLKTMMFNLKYDKSNFVAGFDNVFIGMKDGDIGVRDELFSLVKDIYYETIISDINELSKDIEFKKAIKNLITNIPQAEHLKNFEKYQILLKEFVNIEESDKEAVDIANKIRELEETKKYALNKIKEFKIPTSYNEQGFQQLDIDNRFPIQMVKFNRIFEPLTRSKLDENFNKLLKDISVKLDLDYDQLKSFFAKTCVKKQSNYNNIYTIRNIDDVISALPKSDDNSVSSLSTMKHCLIKLTNWLTTSQPQYTKNVSEAHTQKSFNQLLAEIRTDNLYTCQYLRESYTKIKYFYEIWKYKTALEINRWAVSKKGHLIDADICEALAIVDKANELATGGHRLRDTQILSVLFFLQPQTKGQLCQIQTGEGKTTIVSLLAAIKVMQGETVDVITSNHVLAAEGVKNKMNFYNLLGLSVSTNNLDENYKSGERYCYKADIVYGSISNFQFDFLKDSFLGMNTRAGRSFDRIILDEVDSMIIDNASHIAKLAGPFPGMDSLKYIYIKIWQELHTAEQVIIQEFQKELKNKAQELQELPEIEAKLLYEEFKNDLENSIIPKMKDHIKSSNPTNIDIIPSHLQNYAAKSLDKWINSAIDAKYNYREDEQYIIHSENGNDTVHPVDYANTGITLKNTVWQYGLHQFLQLKHNLHLTSESLTSCFISNLGFINKYGSKIFGLTGTLGSKNEQDLLSSIYNVGFAEIPTYKEKKFVEIVGEVVNNEIFCEKVADDAAIEVTFGRSSLIICETIKDAKSIQNILTRKYKDYVIKMFVNEENSLVAEGDINPGEIIIATNIAGRGTDFKTSAVLEANGGLQVYVAFLPCNKRVEDQAFGRTARQGNNGTAKLLIRRSELENLSTDSDCFIKIKRARDLLEAERIKNIKDVKIQELKFQDELFELFSALYRKLKHDYQNDGKYQYVLDDLKEFWAFWLEKKNFRGLELINKQPVHEFNTFEDEASSIIKGEIMFNPYYSIQQAEYFILNDKLDRAEQSLRHAIRMSQNPEILHGAYIKLFEIAVEKGRALMDKFKKAVAEVFFIKVDDPDTEYKKNAIEYLKLAKKALQIEIEYIKTLFNTKEFTNILVSNDKHGYDKYDHDKHQTIENNFIKHIFSKQQALNLNMEHADSLIQQINEHSGGISVTGRIPDYFAKLNPQNENEKKIKNIILNSELSELSTIGTNTTYVLKEVHDVCPEIVTSTQIHLLAGISLISAGICFPPAMPFTKSIGVTLISEGLCDIAIELINKNSNGQFNKEAYIKGKVISYAISLLTMGVKAILQCQKILNLAKKACRLISTILRKCPYLRTVCELLATKFDQLGNWFEKLETIATYHNMTRADKLKYITDLHKTKNLQKLQYLEEHIEDIRNLVNAFNNGDKLIELTHFENFASTWQQVATNSAINTSKRVAENVIMNKVITPAISSLLVELKPAIRKRVDESIRKYINREKLKCKSYKEIETAIEEIKWSIDYETITSIFKETILTLAKYCTDWRVQLGALVFDQYISWQEVSNYVQYMCKKINDKLECSLKSVNENVDAIINMLIEQFSEEVYRQVVSNTIKTGKDICSVGLLAYNNYKTEKNKIAECIEKNKGFKEGGPAGQEQVHALSDEIKRRIEVYEQNGNVVSIGEQYSDPIKVSYFPPDETNPMGHYVPYGEDKHWSANNGKNNCLFSAVASQYWEDASILRQKTENRIESNPAYYIVPFISGDILMPGGEPAYPANNTQKDAHRILEESHGKSSEAQIQNAKNNPAIGHPRAHVLCSIINHNHSQLRRSMSDLDKITCAENYSYFSSSNKTAFDSKDTQDCFLDEILKSNLGQNALSNLNKNKIEEKLRVPITYLSRSLSMSDVYIGNVNPVKPPVKGIFVIVGHQAGKQNDPNADPHIKTMYPYA